MARPHRSQDNGGRIERGGPTRTAPTRGQMDMADHPELSRVLSVRYTELACTSGTTALIDSALAGSAWVVSTRMTWRRGPVRRRPPLRSVSVTSSD